jgi:hypothetical protein
LPWVLLFASSHSRLHSSIYTFWALTGTNQCALHADPGRAAVMGSAHGRSVTLHSRPDLLDLPHRPLTSAEEVCGLLEETINLVRRGSLDLRTANTIGFLAGIHLKALTQKAEVPETANDEASGGIYMSLFQRLGSAASEGKVFELFPQPPQQDQISASAPLPAPGESVDDPPPQPDNHPGVITVEIE